MLSSHIQYDLVSFLASLKLAQKTKVYFKEFKISFNTKFM